MGNALADFLLEKTKSINQVDLAKALSVSQSFLSRLKSGQIKTADATLAIDMATFFKEPLDKMLGLVGKPQYHSRLKTAMAAEAQRDPVILETFPDEKTKLDFERMRLKDEFVPVRIVATGSLGPGLLIEQEETQSYALIYRQALPKGSDKRMKHERPRIVCAYAKGDSMEPTIGDKSLVAFDLEDVGEIRDGSIYAVYLPDDGMTIKRVLRANEHLILMADNKDTRGFPKALSLKGLGFNPIRGRAVWVWNKL